MVPYHCDTSLMLADGFGLSEQQEWRNSMKFAEVLFFMSIMREQIQQVQTNPNQNVVQPQVLCVNYPSLKGHRRAGRG